MIDDQGRFVWYELLTTDVAAARKFYGDVVGWGAQDASTPKIAYTQLMAATAPVGGLMELPEEGRKMGATPRWVGYVAVDDADAATDRLKGLGGRVYVPATDSNIGRIAVIADPQMATLGMVAGLKPARAAAAPDQPLQVGWHELLAANSKQAFAFYQELFGWQPVHVEPGSLDSYQSFAIGGAEIGGIFTKLARAPLPFWLYYFNVADLAVALQRVKSGGGRVVQGPNALPGDSWIARCIDPQGAMFALQGRSSPLVEAPANELGWTTEWGGFASRGRVVLTSSAKSSAKSPAKPKR
ncbi:VOC family protein [Bradyrhizobium sp.]|uniref:VOC family protein n=1 Tax=Bradyrhizobium sp. TaxID=376 RepID=UPI003C3C3C5E